MINIRNEIGRGSFSTVYRATHENLGGVLAVKKILIKDFKAGVACLEEIEKYEAIELHSNVIRLVDAHFLDTSVFMIMEFCEGGDIDGYMKRNDVDMELKFKFIFESADALCHLHNQSAPVVHRDVKPGDILIKVTFAM